MTGLNVAFTIPGDSFVPAKIDSHLTAILPEPAAGLTRSVSASRLQELGHNKA